MAGEALTPTSYIQHHLHNLTAPVGKGEGMFWHIHVDTFLTAVLMGLVIVVAFWLGTRKATAGVPGKWQAFVEICLEFVDRQARTPTTARASWSRRSPSPSSSGFC